MKVLIAIDDSPYSEVVVEAVLARNWPANTQFMVVTVLEPLEGSATKELYREFTETLSAIGQRRKSAARRYCKKVASKIEAATKGHKVEIEVLEGSPRKEIVDAAVGWEADRIMLGAHGSDVCPRNLLGSVSRGVANHAPCTVEIIRSTAPKKKKKDGSTASCGSTEKLTPMRTATV